jgi:hypothetical protein
MEKSYILLASNISASFLKKSLHMVSLTPLINNGFDLISRLERQQKAYDEQKESDPVPKSLPIADRVTYDEVQAWYLTCFRLIDETFGKDSDERKLLDDALKLFDEKHADRSDYALKGAERLANSVGVLKQLEAGLLGKGNPPTADQEKILNDLLTEWYSRSHLGAYNKVWNYIMNARNVEAEVDKWWKHLCVKEFQQTCLLMLKRRRI